MLTTLNHFPVIQQEHHINGWVTVMVHRDGDPMPYVVATWWYGLGTQWSWGHYCHDLDEARDQFEDVAKRNRSRGHVERDSKIAVFE